MPFQQTKNTNQGGVIIIQILLALAMKMLGNHKVLTDTESAQLDSLRGVSAIAVIFGHANQLLVAPTYDKASIYFGLLAQSAVMVFFVLSGFLIAKSISKNIDRNAGSFSIWQYINDRALRIIPALIFSSLLIFTFYMISSLIFPSGTNQFMPSVYNELSRTGLQFNLGQTLKSLLFMNGFYSVTPDANGPLWSLSIEVWYYALAALVVIFFRKPLILIFALIIFARVALPNKSFFIYLPIWFTGFLICYLHDRDSLPSLRVLKFITLICFTIVICAGINAFLNPQSITYFNLSVGLLFGSLLMLLLQDEFKFTTFFEPAAKYSYTLYIVHMPIFLFIFGTLQTKVQGSIFRSVALAIIAILIAIMFSAIFARWVENKVAIKSLIKRLTKGAMVRA